VQNSRRIHVDEKTRQAYEWALNQTHQSVAARYARALAEYIRDSVPEQEVQGENGKYHELLYAVGTKYPGESRHETALRYIRQAERRTDTTTKQGEG
jgi:hypothetical protein